MAKLLLLLLTLLFSLSSPAIGEYSDFLQSSLAPRTTVYRVEGVPNTRLSLGGGGSRGVQGDNTPFLNFGQRARADEFLARKISQGMEGATLKQFGVPTSYVDGLRSSSVLESEVHLFPNAPI